MSSVQPSQGNGNVRSSTLTFRPASPADFIDYAKHLSKLTGTSLPRSEQLLARLYGYSGLHELQAEMEKPGAPGPYVKFGLPHTFAPSEQVRCNEQLQKFAARLESLLAEAKLENCPMVAGQALELELLSSPVQHRECWRRLVSNGQGAGDWPRGMWGALRRMFSLPYDIEANELVSGKVDMGHSLGLWVFHPEFMASEALEFAAPHLYLALSNAPRGEAVGQMIDEGHHHDTLIEILSTTPESAFNISRKIEYQAEAAGLSGDQREQFMKHGWDAYLRMVARNSIEFSTGAWGAHSITLVRRGFIAMDHSKKAINLAAHVLLRAQSKDDSRKAARVWDCYATIVTDPSPGTKAVPIATVEAKILCPVIKGRVASVAEFVDEADIYGQAYYDAAEVIARSYLRNRRYRDLRAYCLAHPGKSFALTTIELGSPTNSDLIPAVLNLWLETLNTYQDCQMGMDCTAFVPPHVIGSWRESLSIQNQSFQPPGVLLF